VLQLNNVRAIALTMTDTAALTAALRNYDQNFTCFWPKRHLPRPLGWRLCRPGWPIRRVVEPMKYTMRVLARAKHGAQLEDLGISLVAPKPKIFKPVNVWYRGKHVSAVIVSIYPERWESRPITMPTIQVEITETVDVHET
jgi:hypothetical protein